MTFSTSKKGRNQNMSERKTLKESVRKERKSAVERLDEKKQALRAERDEKKLAAQEQASEEQKEAKKLATKTKLSEVGEFKLDDFYETAERIIMDEFVMRRTLSEQEELISARLGLYRLAVKLLNISDWDFDEAVKWADDMGGKESTLALVREAKKELLSDPTKKKKILNE